MGGGLSPNWTTAMSRYQSVALVDRMLSPLRSSMGDYTATSDVDLAGATTMIRFRRPPRAPSICRPPFSSRFSRGTWTTTWDATWRALLKLRPSQRTVTALTTALQLSLSLCDSVSLSLSLSLCSVNRNWFLAPLLSTPFCRRFSASYSPLVQRIVEKSCHTSHHYTMRGKNRKKNC